MAACPMANRWQRNGFTPADELIKRRNYILTQIKGA